MKLFINLLIVGLFLPNLTYGQAMLKWSGRVYDLKDSHTTSHQHELLFKDSETNKIYDVVKSPEIEKLHHDTNKHYDVEIEGYLTSKFLFWGGNLVITKFNILDESDEIGLSNPSFRRTSSARDYK